MGPEVGRLCWTGSSLSVTGSRSTTSAQGKGRRLNQQAAINDRPAAVDHVRATQFVDERSAAGQRRKHAPNHHDHPGPHERVQGECSVYQKFEVMLVIFTAIVK